MKVIFMGTPDFSVGTLEEIIKAGHEVMAVVTQPDKPKGRGKALQYSPVKEAALSHNLEVLQPVKARDEAFIEKLRQYNADVFVVVAYGQILPKEIIDMPKYGCINVHASLLPKYRGAAPIQYAVIDGCEYSGVTTMLMDEGLDTGDILLVSKVKLDEKETGGSLFDKLEDVGAKLLVTTLSKLEDGTITRTKQIEEDSTYVKMIKKSMGKIDFNKSAIEIERLIRGLNPWPSAYTSLDGKTFKIWEANCLTDVEYDSSKLTEIKPGMVIKINKNSFVIKCKEGYLEALSVQLEGKKRMDAGSFLRGYNLEEGTIFNS
ncbi:methionyl-tRNA formyltransferase [Lachnospira multipara]|uniref:methionyl-tRNA formyltransferase n=1 Tax=Lachnospira multipara TaxID=28051 RepID=UPI0004E282B6|nr:methionyl-tRNA formyltransferase [Lachnospira multipara]